MTVLGKYKKQPAEKLDYDVTYDDFFVNRTDALQGVVVTADAGITLATPVVSGNNVKLFLSGGTEGITYEITLRMTTTTGVIKEDEFRVTIKEI